MISVDGPQVSGAAGERSLADDQKCRSVMPSLRQHSQTEGDNHATRREGQTQEKQGENYKAQQILTHDLRFLMSSAWKRSCAASVVRKDWILRLL